MVEARVRRLDWAWLLALGLAVNAWAAMWVTQPGYTDAYYYFDGAVQLAHGQGFSEPYLWNYLAPADLPAMAAQRWPSHLYWMPLPSLVAAPFMAAAELVAGRRLENAVLFRAAQMPFVALAAGLPLLSYLAARRLTGNRRQAWAAALLTLSSPYYFSYWTTTESFALYGVVAAGALLAAYGASRRPSPAGRWLFAAGALAGLAHLTRADGVLVVGCVAVWWAFTQRRKGVGALGALVVGYGLVMGPWFARNLLTVGALLPPGGLRAAWLVDYNDFFTLQPETLTAARYFAAGWGVILAGKWEALQLNLASLVAVQTNLIGLPLLVIGAWRLRRHALLHLAGLYGLALFGLMTFVFSFPGARGGFFHSSAALLPFGWPVMAAGLDAAVEGVARRLPHWRPERSRPVFTALLVVMSAALAALVAGPRLAGWAGQDAAYVEAGPFVAGGGADALVTVNNPPGWYYHTEQAAIVIPSGGRAALLAAMTRYGSRWLVLDANHPAGLEGLYAAPEADEALALRAMLGSGGAPLYVFELTGTP